MVLTFRVHWIFCRLNIVLLDRDNVTSNISNIHNTGVLRWRKDPHSTWTEMALFCSLFTGGSFLIDFLENEILGFDENLTVAL